MLANKDNRSHSSREGLVARWVGDTESMVLSTYSHLIPSEKQDMAVLMNKIVKG